jgi:hypothetical protein
VGALLQSDDALSVLDEEWRPWPKLKEDTAESQNFYDIHDRQKQVPPLQPHLYSSDKFFPYQADLQKLRAFETRQDVERYKEVLKKVLSLFGEGIHESLTRTRGAYLEATAGRLSNANKNA